MQRHTALNQIIDYVQGASIRRQEDVDAGRATRLVVYEPDRPLTLPSKWAPGLPPIPWQAWLEQGFGFLVLLPVGRVSIDAIGRLERRNQEPSARRFAVYRAMIRLTTLGAAATLAFWLWRQRSG